MAWSTGPAIAFLLVVGVVVDLLVLPVWVLILDDVGVMVLGFFFFLVFSALFSSFLIGSLCNLLNYFVMSRVSEPKSAYRNKSVFTPPCFSRKKCKSLCKEYNFSLKYSNKYGIRFSHIFKIPIILNEKPSISIEIPSISIKNLESRSKY